MEAHKIIDSNTGRQKKKISSDCSFHYEEVHYLNLYIYCLLKVPSFIRWIENEYIMYVYVEKSMIWHMLGEPAIYRNMQADGMKNQIPEKAL